MSTTNSSNPSKVFLGGTCNGSLWRDTLVPLLRNKSFNPVVADWTEECYQEELRQRETSQYVLYVITPKMTGVYSIAEVVDDSNKRPDKTIFVRLRDDDGLSFDDKQWKSLAAVEKMITANGGKVFGSLQEVAEFLNAN